MSTLADSSKRWHIVLRCFICGPLGLLFSSPEPKVQVSYCYNAVSVIRPSVNFHIFTFFSGAAHALRCLGHIHPEANPGQSKNRSQRGVSSSSKNFFFRPEGYSNQLNVLQWSISMLEEVLLFLVPFSSFSRVHCTQVSDSCPLGLLLFALGNERTLVACKTLSSA